jgi:hypothetical protein
MFIYKDNVVEEYVDDSESLIIEKCDKVLYDENFLAIIKDKVVYNENGMAIKENEKTLCLYAYLDLGYNRSIYLRIDAVTDIKYNKKLNELIIYKNKEKIKLPLHAIMLLS